MQIKQHYQFFNIRKISYYIPSNMKGLRYDVDKVPYRWNGILKIILIGGYEI